MALHDATIGDYTNITNIGLQLVAVAAAHRREALAACAHAIERVKASAPIWKKEHYADGAAWIEGPDSAPVDT